MPLALVVVAAAVERAARWLASRGAELSSCGAVASPAVVERVAPPVSRWLVGAVAVVALASGVGCSSKRPGDRPAATEAAGSAVSQPPSPVADATPSVALVDAVTAADARLASDSAASDSAASDAAAGDAAVSVAIVDAPMAWSAERAALTLAYRRQHSDPGAVDLTIEPRAIVLHYTGGSSAKSTRSYFDNLRIEASRPELARAGAVNVSSHYVVDRDGTIYRLQPETQFARHCIGLNHLAIGVENAGDGAKWPLTDAQVAADIALVRDLVRRFPTITHLLGHHEVMALRDNPLYVERDRSYRNDKPDPGAAFMARVRAGVADLHLAR